MEIASAAAATVDRPVPEVDRRPCGLSGTVAVELPNDAVDRPGLSGIVSTTVDRPVPEVERRPCGLSGTVAVGSPNDAVDRPGMSGTGSTTVDRPVLEVERRPCRLSGTVVEVAGVDRPRGPMRATSEADEAGPASNLLVEECLLRSVAAQSADSAPGTEVSAEGSALEVPTAAEEVDVDDGAPPMTERGVEDQGVEETALAGSCLAMTRKKTMNKAMEMVVVHQAHRSSRPATKTGMKKTTQVWGGSTVEMLKRLGKKRGWKRLGSPRKMKRGRRKSGPLKKGDCTMPRSPRLQKNCEDSVIETAGNHLVSGQDQEDLHDQVEAAVEIREMQQDPRLLVAEHFAVGQQARQGAIRAVWEVQTPSQEGGGSAAAPLRLKTAGEGAAGRRVARRACRPCHPLRPMKQKMDHRRVAKQHGCRITHRKPTTTTPGWAPGSVDARKMELMTQASIDVGVLQSEPRGTLSPLTGEATPIEASSSRHNASRKDFEGTSFKQKPPLFRLHCLLTPSAEGAKTEVRDDCRGL